MGINFVQKPVQAEGPSYTGPIVLTVLGICMIIAGLQMKKQEKSNDSDLD